MKRLHNATTRLMLALLVGVIAVPAATTGFLRNYESHMTDKSILDIRVNALGDRRRQRAQRRLYWNAIEQFQKQRKAGEDVAKPDINDMDSIETVLEKQDKDTTEHAAAPLTSSDLTRGLSTSQRRLITRYTRAHICPRESLDRLGIPGAYDLCISLVGEDAADTLRVGILNDNIQLRSRYRSAAPSFKLRMQMMSEALDRSNRRESVTRNPRPTPFTQQPVRGWELYPE